jgi:hypothetical protein
MRRVGAPSFAEADLQLLGRFMPHLQGVAQRSRRTARRHALMPVAGIYTIWRMIGGARPAILAAMIGQRASGPGTADTPRRRGIVVPFRRRPEPRDDTQLNAEWNRLMRLAAEASVWRDPDSLAAIQDCLALLRSWVSRDWS